MYWKNRKLFWNTYKLIFRSHPWLTLLEGFSYFLNALIAGIMPLAWKLLFEGIYEIVTGSSIKNALLSIMVFIIFQLAEVLSRLLGRMPNRVFGYREKVAKSLKENLYYKAAKLQLLEFEKSNVYDTFLRAEKSVSEDTPMRLLDCMYQSPALLLSLITMTITVWTFSPYFVIAALLSILPASIVHFQKGKRKYIMKRQQTNTLRAKDYYWSLFLKPEITKEIRVYKNGDFFKKHWMELQKSLNEEEYAFWKKNIKYEFPMEGFRVMGYGMGIILSTVFFNMGLFSISSFGAVIQSFQNLQMTYDQFLRNFNSMRESYLFFNDYILFMNLDTEKHGKINPGAVLKSIELQNVCFQYPNQDQKALNNISLSIKAGEKIALVGENGSGKSTLCKIISGLFSPDEGCALWNGVNYKNCNNNTFRSLSAVFQDYMKYHLTVSDNIALGCIEKINDYNALFNALEKSRLSSLKLDTQLGREFDGEELSGGQWQKLAISRAVISDSELILFDEPTAALDPITESEIFHDLLGVLSNKTLLLVTHRIGSARLADKIIVMEEGKIVEQGTHEQLLNKNGKYADMYKMQSKWYVA